MNNKMALVSGRYDDLTVNPSRYISKLDVKDKASLMMILTKLESGILLMSSTYCRYFQAIIPMIAMIDEKRDSKELVTFIRKKFASMTRTYIRTDKETEKEQSSLYSLKTELYDISLDPNVKQLESHIVVSLVDIDDGLKDLMSNILDMAQDIDIDKWKSNGRIDKITKSIHNINLAIMTTFDDFSKAFMDGESIASIGKFSEEKYRRNTILSDVLGTPTSIIMPIDSTIAFLNDLYNVILMLHYNMGACIDISKPINTDDTTKDIKDMYGDFCEMNDKAIKNDPKVTGFDPTAFNKKRRKMSFFWDRNDSEPNTGNEQDNSSDTSEWDNHN